MMLPALLVLVMMMPIFIIIIIITIHLTFNHEDNGVMSKTSARPVEDEEVWVVGMADTWGIFG